MKTPETTKNLKKILKLASESLTKTTKRIKKCSHSLEKSSNNGFIAKDEFMDNKPSVYGETKNGKTPVIVYDDYDDAFIAELIHHEDAYADDPMAFETAVEAQDYLRSEGYTFDIRGVKQLQACQQ